MMANYRRNTLRQPKTTFRTRPKARVKNVVELPRPVTPGIDSDYVKEEEILEDFLDAVLSMRSTEEDPE